MSEGTRIEFPDHPVIIGVDIGSPEGDKTVLCVEYSEYLELKSKADIADELAEALDSILPNQAAQIMMEKFIEGLAETSPEGPYIHVTNDDKITIYSLTKERLLKARALLNKYKEIT